MGIDRRKVRYVNGLPRGLWRAMEPCGVQWTLGLLHRSVSRCPPSRRKRRRKPGRICAGANARGAGYEPEPQGAAPGSAQRDHLRKTPLSEPGFILTTIL